MKKALSGLLALALLALTLLAGLCVPLSASARLWEDRNVKRSGDYTYIPLKGKNACLTWCSNLDGAEEIVLPSTLDGHKVTEIDTETFCYDSALRSVVIPEGVTTLNGGLFVDCPGLTRVVLPDSVKKISGNPFAGCAALQEIVISENHPYLYMLDGMLFSKTDLRLICCLPSAGAESVDVPQGIEIIGENAFLGCGSLTSVTFPDSLKTLEADCFYGCTGLTSVTVPEGVTKLGDSCFSECSALASVSLPATLKTVGDNPFCRCDSLTEILLPDGHKYLSFADGFLISKKDKRLVCGLSACLGTSCEIPEGVVTLGVRAFCENKSLTSVIIPKGVKALGASCFDSCSALTDVVIPNTVKTIGDSCFYYCSLKTVTVPKSVTKIGWNVFDQIESPTLIVVYGSTAQKYAKKNGIPWEKKK